MPSAERNDHMKRVIIVGSPRSNGRSAHLAEMLFEANIDERPQDELFLVPLSEVEVGPCIGCNECLYADFLHREKTCAINPRCYHEDEYRIPKMKGEPKVLVVGGGAAGMYAALRSAGGRDQIIVCLCYLLAGVLSLSVIFLIRKLHAKELS